MSLVADLINKNKEWAESVKAENPEFFSNLSKGQSPKYLWIGCADSRVPASQACGLKPGEMFVHRNIANVIVHTDMNSMSVLQYAVQYLGVSDIIVCGHTSCGGVAGALGDKPLGLIDSWLRHIKDVYMKHRDELEGLTPNSPEQVNRLVELNVRQQVHNICHTTIVQDAWARGQELRVHGLVYDLGDGLLKDQELQIASKSEIENIFKYQ